MCFCQKIPSFYSVYFSVLGVFMTVLCLYACLVLCTYYSIGVILKAGIKGASCWPGNHFRASFCSRYKVCQKQVAHLDTGMLRNMSVLSAFQWIILPLSSRLEVRRSGCNCFI
jgi:hypothetical protein